MICGPAAGAAYGLSSLTPAGKASPHSTHRRKLLGAVLLATTALVPVLLARPAAAQTVEWDGSASNDWDTATNWDTNAVPTAADDVVIDDTSSNTTIIAAAVNAQANGLAVGDAGLPADALWVLGGGTLATTAPTQVGVAAGSAGSIIVTGAGSQWNSGEGILLGIEGTGGLQVLVGGQVLGAGGILGFLSGSFGTATVNGAGAAWTNSDALFVGGIGDGLLTITNQGQVSNTEGHIGYEAGSTGKVTVRDAGSSWTNTQGLYVGYFGDGTLEVLNGADVTSTIGALGAGPDASGSAIISGAGSTWSMTDNFVVGTGVLTIENGGQVATTGTSLVGFSETGTADATVTGAGSTWITNEFHAGVLGAGTVTVSDGATLTSTVGYIGAAIAAAPNAQGAVTVTGAGSTWTNTGDLTVGNFGNGTLDIADQGQVNVTGASIIGRDAGSQGAATVTGAGWTTGSVLRVGWEGSGTLVIDNGVVTDTDGSIATRVGSAGAVTVTNGSTWSNGGALSVGFAGNAELSIDGGSTVTNVNAFVGTAYSGVGAITVSGAGSTWTSSGDLTLGSNGQGALTVADQGVVNVLGAAFLGEAPGGDGIATVTGAGSLFSVGGNLFVGEDGDSGVLGIADQGVVDVAGISTIGFDVDAQGSATVAGAGSTWTTAGDLIVGLSGNGTLDILDGGAVMSADGMLGHDPDSSGSVKISGTGSTWTMTNRLAVGVGGAGTLTIEDGGDVTAAVASDVGFFSVANGDVAVTGAGSSWTTSELSVGIYGTGAVAVDDGATLASSLAEIGEFADSQGSVTITGAGSAWTNSGNLSIGRAGTGTLVVDAGGKVTNVDARIAALPGSTGEVSVTGAGSDWTSSNALFVGAAGTGALTIAEGGAVSANFSGIGADFNSSGTATVTGAGSTWNIVNTHTVGGHGHGEMIVADQATVNVGTDAFLGASTAGDGTATVTGAGSLFSVGGALVVGDQGEGTLAVLDGAKAASVDGVIGQFGSGVGEVTVSGANSLWELTGGYFAVGESGTGMLTIADGGLVNMADNLGFTVIGASGVGEVNVVDASWVNGGVLVVGNAGTGVLALDNATLVNSGGVVGGGPGSSGAVTIANGSIWTNNGQLQVGSSGTGEVTIASGGIVDTGIAIIADNAGSQGTLNIGAAAGDAAVVPGTLATTNLTFGAGVGTLVFNHTSQDYLFSPEIDGVGAIDALAGRTLLATAGTYTGSTTIHGGATLSIDGSIGGTLDVLSGGRLEGSGTAGFVTVAGTIAPGNSIGTFHVAGDYTQAAGSIYEVEIDATGSSDLIDVAGMATLTGGTVEVIPFPDFALATPYTILTAAGGVTGTFDGASMGFSSAFLSPQLTYGTNDVTFAIARTGSFAGAALTPNQEAAAEGADSLGAGNAVWDTIALLPSASDAPAAFDAISGEVHASAASVLIEDSRFVREAVDARLRAAFAGVGAKAMPVLAYGDEGPEAAPADTGRFAAWGHAFGSWGEWSSDGNAASLTRDTGGFVLGGDMAVADIWRLGLLAGYSSSSFDIDDRASSGSADSYHLGAYAGTKIGKWGLRFGGAYSRHAIDTARTASFAGFTDSLEAEYDAATAQVFAEAGYRIDTARVSFEPFANLVYVNLHTDGFTETGGAAALTASSSSQNTTFTTLGLRAETTLPLGAMTARLHGMLGWRHAFGDVSPTSELAFAGGSAFTIAGVPIAEDAAIIEAGLDLALSPNANLGIAYNGQIGSGVSDHGAKARFEVRF